MKSSRLILLACLLITSTAVGCAKKAPPEASEEKTAYKDKIVGAWEIVTSESGRKPGDVMEYGSDGKLKRTLLPDHKTAEGTYEIDGDKITTHFKQADKEVKQILTIKSLNDTRLVTVNEKGQKNEYKKTTIVPQASASNKDKIVGAWEAAKTWEFPYEIALEFSKDGKFRMTVKMPQPIVKEGTYAVAGDKITTTRKEGTKTESDTWTITTLDATQLVYVESDGATVTYKKTVSKGTTSPHEKNIVGLWEVVKTESDTWKIDTTLDFTSQGTMKGTNKAGKFFDYTYVIEGDNVILKRKTDDATASFAIKKLTQDALVLNGPGGQFETRKKTAAPTSNINRTFWKHSKGIIAKATTGDIWLGKAGDDTQQYVEKQRTPEFVELYEKGRDRTVRLFNDRCTVKNGNGSFEKLYDGKWLQ